MRYLFDINVILVPLPHPPFRETYSNEKRHATESVVIVNVSKKRIIVQHILNIFYSLQQWMMMVSEGLFSKIVTIVYQPAVTGNGAPPQKRICILAGKLNKKLSTKHHEEPVLEKNTVLHMFNSNPTLGPRIKAQATCYCTKHISTNSSYSHTATH